MAEQTAEMARKLEGFASLGLAGVCHARCGADSTLGRDAIRDGFALAPLSLAVAAQVRSNGSCKSSREFSAAVSLRPVASWQIREMQISWSRSQGQANTS